MVSALTYNGHSPSPFKKSHGERSGELSYFSGEILLDLAFVMTRGIVQMDDQLFLVDSPFGVRIFLG
jgi:hypothetical protein